MALNVALVGNPNSGKTTLFNELTGSNQYVGNWPGVTVEKKMGKVNRIKEEEITVTDLPGIYSFSIYSPEELITREYIEENNTDVIINIVDVSNIERNLFLTLQLMEMQKPMVIALNMMDVLTVRGDVLDINKLSHELNLPVIPIIASKGKGISELLKAVIEQKGVVPEQKKIYSDEVEHILKILEEELNVKICPYTHAVRFFEEGNITTENDIHIDNTKAEKLNHLVDTSIIGQKMDRDMIITDQKYRYITDIVGKCMKKNSEQKISISFKIDRIITHRVFAIPIFFGIMYLMFWLAFGPIGGFFKEHFEYLINDILIGNLAVFFENIGVSEWLYSLVIDGILGGVGAVLGFLPEITILFLTLSILEDSGYMARAAFIMDRLFRRFGLSGKSFIPMIMGFGCTVPALMATRTLENEKDRHLTMMITPFMSCGARLPIYALLAGTFFEEKYRTSIVFSMYLIGIVIAFLSALILKHFIIKKNTSGFLMELPEYRMPTPKNLILHTWERVKGFVIKAGTVLLLACVAIWFLQSFNFSLNMVEDPTDSMFGSIGKVVAPIFAPLGFGDWRAANALLTGIIAKEAVVGTMEILYTEASPLADNFTPLSSYAFMVFSLLYLPCLAAFATLKRELNSWKKTLVAVGYQTGVAWVAGCLIYQIGSLFIS